MKHTIAKWAISASIIAAITLAVGLIFLAMVASDSQSDKNHRETMQRVNAACGESKPIEIEHKSSFSNVWWQVTCPNRTVVVVDG